MIFDISICLLTTRLWALELRGFGFRGLGQELRAAFLDLRREARQELEIRETQMQRTQETSECKTL